MINNNYIWDDQYKKGYRDGYADGYKDGQIKNKYPTSNPPQPNPPTVWPIKIQPYDILWKTW